MSRNILWLFYVLFPVYAFRLFCRLYYILLSHAKTRVSNNGNTKQVLIYSFQLCNFLLKMYLNKKKTMIVFDLNASNQRFPQ